MSVRKKDKSELRNKAILKRKRITKKIFENVANGNQTISFGQFLKQRREEIGLESVMISKSLNVKERHIEIIEEDRIGENEHKNYLINLARTYAKFLEIDSKKINDEIKKILNQSNIDNKKHILLNIGEEDRIIPTKEQYYNVVLIIVILLILFFSYHFIYANKDSLITNDALIENFEKIDFTKINNHRD
jgi:cytoskeletal protein RodZ